MAFLMLVTEVLYAAQMAKQSCLDNNARLHTNFLSLIPTRKYFSAKMFYGRGYREGCSIKIAVFVHLCRTQH